MIKTKDTYIRLRCTEEFKGKVEELAKKENRTVSNYIESLLLREIEEEEKKMKFELRMAERQTKERESVKVGFTMASENVIDSELIKVFETKAEALKELEKHESTIHKTSGNIGSFYEVTEYFVQEQGEADIWQFSKMPWLEPLSYDEMVEVVDELCDREGFEAPAYDLLFKRVDGIRREDAEEILFDELYEFNK